MGRYDKLQNGSDIRGVAMPDAGTPVTLTGGAAFHIARAFVRWLAQRTGRPAAALRVGIGHDSRLTAAPLKAAIAAGCNAEGAAALDCGLASTPAMFMGTLFEATAFDGAIMITASHLPKERNGMKFFTRDGGLDKPDIAALLALADKMDGAPCDAGLPACNLMALYARHLRGVITAQAQLGERPLEGLHIVVDAGNGAGGFFSRDVLEPLGANCTGSQFLEPDGSFPNHIPNPEDKTAMASVCAATLAASADLGIIFDTDVDRMSAVLPGGETVNRDALIAMMAAILAPQNPGATVVTDSVTSDRLTAFLQDGLGLVHHRFKRGYKNVINEAVRLNKAGTNAPLAIETSGHGAFAENYFLDDGAYMAVKQVAAAARARQSGEGLHSLIAALPPAAEEAEVRIPIIAEDFAACGKHALAAFEAAARAQGIRVADGFEGVRLALPGVGWALLRNSLHDPVLPLNMESETPGGCARLSQTVRGLLAGVPGLDLAGLEG